MCDGNMYLFSNVWRHWFRGLVKMLEDAVGGSKVVLFWRDQSNNTQNNNYNNHSCNNNNYFQSCTILIAIITIITMNTARRSRAVSRLHWQHSETLAGSFKPWFLTKTPRNPYLFSLTSTPTPCNQACRTTIQPSTRKAKTETLKITNLLTISSRSFSHFS